MTPQQEIRETLATMFDQWNREDQASYLQVFRKLDGAWLVVNENSARVPLA